MTSLKDQLLKAGLIDPKKAKQAEKEKRKQDKQARRTGQSEQDEIKAAAQAARAAKAERDRELNRQRDLEAEQKAIQAQIRQLVENHRQQRGSGDVEYNFTDGNKIKKIRVSNAVHRQIVNGVLAIVRLGEGYELVPRIVANKIAQRDASCVVVSNAQAANTQMTDEEDPYKDYVIPDDLMW
ncbi:DUF2058 domain-containing protein [Saccharophagus sp. K07]|jgi:uncharacterized protein YaiL (DUF2058 family)|uniref:DUF2058 domain-containing protein n=1 Tax=Saccharophagus sp. K07 TaxID=2283636 RepID=UPI0016522DF4|nr:DUF2058 domain-containing protein [Saccharophagus sp. K07]MBC6906819.1 DUF2058 domain-containing protein [Saccharophagus sp. K07]